MSGKTAWIVILLAAAALIVFGRVTSFAQRDFRGQGSASEIGRYRAVNVSHGEIILLDTATGNLFTAGPKDIKPHSALRRDSRKDSAEPPVLDGRDKDKGESKEDFLRRNDSKKDFFDKKSDK
jgi:hypothetical protein